MLELYFNNNKKYWIDIAKQFIDDGISIKFEDNYQQFLKEQEIMNNIKKQKELDKIDKLHDIAIKVNKIIDSNIDFTKYGWVKRVAEILNIHHRWVRPWINKRYPDLILNAHCRNKIN